MPEFILENYTYPYTYILDEIRIFQDEVISASYVESKYIENYDFESRKSIKYLAETVLKNGGINVLRKNSKIVGISSYYHWNQVTIGAVRYLKLPKVAHSSFPLILNSIPFQIDQAKKNNSKAFCILVNSDNSKMLNFFKKQHADILSRKEKSVEISQAMQIIHRFQHFENEVYFNYCKQNLFYIPLEQNFVLHADQMFHCAVSIK